MLALTMVVWSVRGADYEHGGAVRRVLFGSCNKQHAPQPLWATMSNAGASAFFWTGDAVYPNRSDADALETAFRLQRLRPEYASFLETVSVVDGTWDDHDLGVNDAGRDAAELDRRRELFFDFLGRTKTRRNGTYVSHRFGDDLVVILLDTRSFRDSYLVPSVGAWCRGVPVIGRMMPLLAALVRLSTRWLGGFGDVLGEAQWQWLERELLDAADAANFVVVVSSIQFATSNPSFESWGHFPRAKRRFQDLLSATKPKGFVLLSGDVHHAEIAKVGPLTEVTSSGMTHTLATSKVTRLLFPPLLAFFRSHRPHPDAYATQLNYGQIDLLPSPAKGKEPSMVVSVRGVDGLPILPTVQVRSRPYGDDDGDGDQTTCQQQTPPSL